MKVLQRGREDEAIVEIVVNDNALQSHRLPTCRSSDLYPFNSPEVPPSEYRGGTARILHKAEDA